MGRVSAATAVTQEEGGHPIQVVARRTGLTPDVIRVWERRYGAVEPRRTETNRRLYSDEDVERLRLLRLATLGGRRIGDVASLGASELAELVEADRAAEAGRAPGPAGADAPAADHVGASIEAIERLDDDALEDALARARVSLAVPVLLEHVLMPILATIGERWREGKLRVSHEHMASAIVRSFLTALRTGHRPPRDAPELIVATPAGQQHEMGALAAAAAAALDGWHVTYLGPDLPAEEIAAAVEMRGARAVALSIIYPSDDPRLGAELRSLRRLVGADVALLVGGAAAGSYAGDLEAARAETPRDLAALRERLERVRAARGR
jgi:DNA-binding transcriptional MerR regulator/methylmalonyl-CoA mutase cobalamin-binding subunit